MTRPLDGTDEGDRAQHKRKPQNDSCARIRDPVDGQSEIMEIVGIGARPKSKWLFGRSNPAKAGDENPEFDKLNANDVLRLRAETSS
jgi:hypothetical protein